jgi:hypothetical protein
MVAWHQKAVNCQPLYHRKTANNGRLAVLAEFFVSNCRFSASFLSSLDDYPGYLVIVCLSVVALHQRL